jgi:precorrin-2 dehydrogenase/sirohydrochlorin ferrochelatase
MLPIILDLRGRKALVVGGGRIAYRKAKALADEGAHVTVISPDFVDDFSSMPNSTLVQRTFEAGDTDGFQLVITATGNHTVDQLIYDEGNARGTWVNSADDPDRCSFYLAATHRDGNVIVALVQNYFALEKSLRELISNIIMFKLNKTQTQKIFNENVEHAKDKFEVIRDFVFDEPYNWMFINISSQKIFKGFDEILYNEE